jgi:branched-chain amino acid transport system substrate-binding protein
MRILGLKVITLFFGGSLLASVVLAEPPQLLLKQIKLGLVVSLTGPAAEQGKNWLTGAELARTVLRKEGIDLKLLVEDDHTQPARAVSAFKKLVELDKVDGVIGGTWDYLAEVTEVMVRRARIPYVTPTNPVEILSEAAQSNPWFFTNGLSIGSTLKAIQHAFDKLKVSSIAIIVPNVPFGVVHADAIEDLVKQQGVKVLLREDFDLSAYQIVLRALALKVSELKPDAVFCIAEYGALAQFNKEFRLRGSDAWLITTQHLDEAVRLSGNPLSWKKSIGIYPKATDKVFIDLFKEQYKEAPKVYAAEGFDAALFLARALAAKVDISKSVFSTLGSRGKLSSEPGKTEIAYYEASALSVSRAGRLVPFAGSR